MRPGFGDERREVRIEAMSVFIFNGFVVRNESSAMKINTDSVLLGALCTISSSDTRILDIGTGTGVVALIVAKRLSSLRMESGQDGILGPDDILTGIDADGISAEEAAGNFANSPWSGNMVSIHVPLAGYPPKECDLIVSNPPYFDSTLRSPDKRRRGARHTGSLSFRDVLDYAALCLSIKGRVSMILPASDKMQVLAYGADKGLYLNRIVYVSNLAGREADRVVVEFSKNRARLVMEELAVHRGREYDPEYLKRTSELYCRP